MTMLLENALGVVRHARHVDRDMAVAIEGRQICAVGPTAELRAAYPAAARVDCSGLLLLPGMINAHNHVYEVVLRGVRRTTALEDWLRTLIYPVARVMTAQDYYHAGVLGAADAVRTGTTSLVSQLTNFARFHADEEARAFRDVGIRARVARAASTSSSIDPTEEGTPDAEFADTAAFIDRWAEGDLVRGQVGPAGLFSCDDDTLLRLKRLATETGGNFYIHLAETRGQTEAAKRRGFRGQIDQARQIGLLDEQTVVAHAVWVDDEEIEMLAAAGVSVVHNPSSNMVLASGIAPVVKLRERGVRVSVATDGPASNDAQDMVAEMKAAVGVARVSTLDPAALTAHDALEMATTAGTAAIGMDGRLGRIEPGQLADVVGIRMLDNPSLEPVTDPIGSLVFAGSGRDVALTIVDGQVLFRGGDFPTMDVAASMAYVRHETLPRVQRALGIEPGSAWYTDVTRSS